MSAVMPMGVQREKIYEALAFFAANVRNPGLVKLYKLLYYLDLLHFRRTGRPVTGLRYEAWPMGPVPAALQGEIDQPGTDLHARFVVEKARRVTPAYETPTVDTSEQELDSRATAAANSYFQHTKFRPKRPFENEFLTRRELEIAKELAEIFKTADSQTMSDVSHNKFGPWQKALFKGKKNGIRRPEIDLMEGVVACGKKGLELPLDELREIVAEREAIDAALR